MQISCSVRSKMCCITNDKARSLSCMWLRRTLPHEIMLMEVIFVLLISYFFLAGLCNIIHTAYIQTYTTCRLHRDETPLFFYTFLHLLLLYSTLHTMQSIIKCPRNSLLYKIFCHFKFEFSIMSQLWKVFVFKLYRAHREKFKCSKILIEQKLSNLTVFDLKLENKYLTFRFVTSYRFKASFESEANYCVLNALYNWI